MYAHFRHLDGPLAGQERVASADFATIGRHPTSEVPFDPEGDTEVSIRHAAVFRQGGSFMIRDLGSTNGTFVNGRRVRSDRPLEPSDVIRLGPTGPQLVFSVVDSVPPPAPNVAARSPARIRPPVDLEDPVEAAVTKNRTTQRVQVARRETGRWKAIAVGALVAAGLVGGWFGWRNNQQRQAMEAERAALLTQIDGLITEIRTAKAGAAPLAAALGRSQDSATSLRERVSTGHLDPDSLAGLKRTVAERITEERRVLRAAAFNAVAATTPNRPAVGIVFAEVGEQRGSSGSGFAIHSSGDTVWVVTNRHLVTDSAGGVAPRLGVMFNGTAQNFRATAARVDSAADIAILTVVLRGGAPVVHGIGANPGAADPVAVLGFPLGLDKPTGKDWHTSGVSATTLTGTVTSADSTLIKIDGYGTQGSSGSPVLNGAGDVVGIVFGGEKGSNGRVVYAVPASEIRRVLIAAGVGPIK